MEIETRLFFCDKIWNNDSKEKAYIIEAIRNANPESEFGAKTEKLRNLSDESIAQNFIYLQQQGYNIMLGYLNGELIGHTAYQEHSNSYGIDWHVFQFYVAPEHRGKGYTNQLTKKLLLYAQQKKVNKVKVGAGRHSVTKTILEKLKKEQEKLGIRIDLENYWVFLK